MDKETIAHIFEPFFTTKEKGKARDSASPLSMESSNSTRLDKRLQRVGAPCPSRRHRTFGGGTTFKIYLPAEVPQGGTQAGLSEKQDIPGFKGGLKGTRNGYLSSKMMKISADLSKTC